MLACRLHRTVFQQPLCSWYPATMTASELPIYLMHPETLRLFLSSITHLNAQDDATAEPAASSGKSSGQQQPTPSSPMTRSARDSSLRRLRSGTTLSEGSDLLSKLLTLSAQKLLR